MGATQSTPRITAQDKAILDLKLQRDKVKQYRKKIQIVLDREEEIAKQQLRAGQKDRALVTLRQRKYQESLLQKTDTQLENLEQLVSSIEFSRIQVSVLHGLEQGNEVLKQINKEMNIERVDKLMDETAEAQAYQREISEMLSNTLTNEEEEDVQEELRRLQEEETVGVAKPEADVHLPNVPQNIPVSDEVIDEEAPVSERARVALPA
ncbi:hypothetical protein SCHPADRAFT_922383 [Schizopora paradoxa]|uniref:Snf7-domain-containing protein n=1 Tax=Schizopora paradoxa TaxID=27342 RepID=A0A0H2RBZ7_9AGAM|nr:hypothetical protein SCHPADRAFT_922383 [Schizopora paradoxa]